MHICITYIRTYMYSSEILQRSVRNMTLTFVFIFTCSPCSVNEQDNGTICWNRLEFYSSIHYAVCDPTYITSASKL